MLRETNDHLEHEKHDSDLSSFEVSTHTDDLRFRMVTIELLRTAKKHYTYKQLSDKTELPITVLSRYAKGHILPNSKRARNLWTALSKIVSLETDLEKRIKFNSDGYFDNTSIVGDVNLLRQAANYALAKFAGKRITKVLTAAVDGIPLGTMVANALGVNLVIAKGSKEVGVSSFLEETYILSGSKVTMILYVPKDAIKSRDSVLIVDDTIRGGDTQIALVNLVSKAKAELSAIFSLIAIGDTWQRKMPKNCPVEIILRLNSPND